VTARGRSPLGSLKAAIRRLEARRSAPIEAARDRALTATGAVHARLLRLTPPRSLEDAEFRVFSQYGEDGIIQHLVHRVPIVDERFVEFGVDDYRESNTRFLLVNDNWSGLVLDAGTAHVQFVERSGLAWRHTIDARQAFITRENINDLLRDGGCEGDIGLLSIDVDGNDYWIWDAIEVTTPRIVIVEYNSVFGPDRAVTIPYRSDFDRFAAHHSGLYFGASLAALATLGRAKGYRLVGSVSAGNNAFFVRDDVAGDLDALDAATAWRPSRFRESRGEDGSLTYVTDPVDRLRLIGELPVVDIETAQTLRIAELH
jgi:hypothetical protein